MALARAPKPIEDRRAEALIDKAIAVHPSKRAGRKQSGRIVTVSLRIPEQVIDFIDEEIEAMEEPRLPRHTWLLQAIYAKYRSALAAREESKSTRNCDK